MRMRNGKAHRLCSKGSNPTRGWYNRHVVKRITAKAMRRAAKLLKEDCPRMVGIGWCF